jgi:hypothetical protein
VTQESSLDIFCHVIFDVNIDVMDVRGRPQEKITFRIETRYSRTLVLPPRLSPIGKIVHLIEDNFKPFFFDKLGNFLSGIMHIHCKMTVRYKISVNCKICLKSTKNTNKNLQILSIFLTLPVILFAFNYPPVIPCEIYG